MADLDPKAILTAHLTDVGVLRDSNQDHYGEFEHEALPRRLLVVADGMGGHRGGEVASRLAVEVVGEVFAATTEPPDQTLLRCFEAANARIHERAAGDHSLAGMGTTGVALLATGDEPGPLGSSLWIASVGDSRAYRLRDGKLEQLTRDHSVVGELVRRGHITEEEARLHPRRNEILRALGTQPTVEVELIEIDAHDGDQYLLCSDGLSGMLHDDEIAEVLQSEEPDLAAQKLVAMANECGGTDNITVQIARLPSSGSDRTTHAPDASPEGSSKRGVADADAADADEDEDDLGEGPGQRLRWAAFLAAIVGLIWLLTARG